MKNEDTTEKILYTTAMKIFHLLAFSPIVGGFWLLMLFFLSFLLVHLLLFAKAGWEAKLGKKPQTNKTEQPAPPPEKKAPEPVYYIVEKKKKRPKNTYSPPREIHFH